VAAPEYWKNGNEHKPKLQVSDYFNMMKVFKLHRPNGPIPQSELRYSIIMTQSMFSGREHRLCHNLGTPCNERQRLASDRNFGWIFSSSNVRKTRNPITVNY